MISHKYKYIKYPIIILIMFMTGSAWSQNTLNVGDKIPVVKMAWSKVSLKNIANRVQLASELVSNRKIEKNEKNQLDALMKEPETWNRWISPYETAPEIKVKILKDYNEIRVMNRMLIDKHDGDDVGEYRAIEIAAKYLEKFRASGLLSHKAYNLNDVQVGYGRIGGGSLRDQEQYDWIVEYRITFRPNIDGIQLANAGVRLAIHRTGKLMGVRLGGVSAKKTDTTRVVKVPLEKAEDRLKSIIPKDMEPSVAWSRVMYVMPENKQSAIVEPLMVYSYSLITESDGQRIVSRRQTVGFSLSDENAKAIDFSSPARKHEGTDTERK